MADWLASHESAPTWAVENFGGRSASELEIIATIVYVATIFPSEKALHRSGPGRRVREVKPRFAEQYVLAKCRRGTRDEPPAVA